MILYYIICILLFIAVCYSVWYYDRRRFVCNYKESDVIYRPNNIKARMSLIAFLFLFLFWLLTAFRNEQIGNDTITYIEFFQTIINDGVGSVNGIEYGYQALCYVIGLISPNPQFFLIIVATICWGGLGIYIFEYSENKLLSVCFSFCICFSQFTNILRQDIAMIICLFAYQAIKHRKRLKFIVLVLIASTFHTSALAFLLLLAYKLFPRTIKAVIYVAVIVVLLSISGILSSFIEKLVPKYASYIVNQEKGVGYLALSVGILRNIAISWFIFKSMSNSVKNVEKADCVLLVLFSGLGFIATIISRVSEYFLMPCIVTLSNSFGNKKIKNAEIIQILICGLLLCYFIVSLLVRPEWSQLYPYKFFK